MKREYRSYGVKYNKSSGFASNIELTGVKDYSFPDVKRIVIKRVIDVLIKERVVVVLVETRREGELEFRLLQVVATVLCLYTKGRLVYKLDHSPTNKSYAFSNYSI